MQHALIYYAETVVITNRTAPIVNLHMMHESEMRIIHGSALPDVDRLAQYDASIEAMKQAETILAKRIRERNEAEGSKNLPN